MTAERQQEHGGREKWRVTCNEGPLLKRAVRGWYLKAIRAPYYQHFYGYVSGYSNLLVKLEYSLSWFNIGTVNGQDVFVFSTLNHNHDP